MFDTSYTTIEKVRETYEEHYKFAGIFTKVQLKCWLHYAESRHKNNNLPFRFTDYCNVMNTHSYIEQVYYDVIDCSDLGGKNSVLQFLTEGS